MDSGGYHNALPLGRTQATVQRRQASPSSCGRVRYHYMDSQTQDRLQWHSDILQLRLPALPVSALVILCEKFLKLFLSVPLLFPYAVHQLSGLKKDVHDSCDVKSMSSQRRRLWRCCMQVKREQGVIEWIV